MNVYIRAFEGESHTNTKDTHAKQKLCGRKSIGCVKFYIPHAQKMLRERERERDFSD
jgi:hypothetical protein